MCKLIWNQNYSDGGIALYVYDLLQGHWTCIVTAIGGQFVLWLSLCFGPAGLNSRGFKTATTIVWTLRGQNLEFSFIYSLDFLLVRMGPGYLT